MCAPGFHGILKKPLKPRDGVVSVLVDLVVDHQTIALYPEALGPGERLKGYLLDAGRFQIQPAHVGVDGMNHLAVQVCPHLLDLLGEHVGVPQETALAVGASAEGLIDGHPGGSRNDAGLAEAPADGLAYPATSSSTRAGYA